MLEPKLARQIHELAAEIDFIAKIAKAAGMFNKEDCLSKESLALVSMVNRWSETLNRISAEMIKSDASEFDAMKKIHEQFDF